MAKLIEVNVSEKERMCLIAKALSVPARIDILNLLFFHPLSVQDIAQELGIPASSAGVHINILEEAGIIRTEKKIVNGSIYKIGHVENYFIHFFLRASYENINVVSSVTIPVGSYTDCFGESSCGLISETGYIGTEDDPRSFFLLERTQAQLVWVTNGYIEYKAPNILPAFKKCKRLQLSLELCSEALGFDDNYKSDIYLRINDKDCGFYRSNGDYGARRGILTPAFWSDGLTQYGKLVTWNIDENGVFINGEHVADITSADLNIEDSNFIKLRFENREDSEYNGGINIFGEKTGDYNQSILLTIEH